MKKEGLTEERKGGRKKGRKQIKDGRKKKEVERKRLDLEVGVRVPSVARKITLLSENKNVSRIFVTTESNFCYWQISFSLIYFYEMTLKNNKAKGKYKPTTKF